MWEPRIRIRGLISKLITFPLARLLIKFRISANMLTVFGLLVVGGAAGIISSGNLLLGAGIMVLGSGMDMLDGAVARLTGKNDQVGSFLDSTLDRLGETFIFLGLLIHFMRSDNDIGVYLAATVLAVSLLISYLRAKGDAVGVDSDVGVMGRPERIVVLGIGLAIGYPLYALALILLLGSLTFIQRFAHIVRRIKG